MNENGRKRRHKRFWGLYAQPSASHQFILGIIPFVLLIAAYVITSIYRHHFNPDDKLFPTLTKMCMTIASFSYNTKDQIGGEFMQWLWHPDIFPDLRRHIVSVINSDLVIDTVSSLLRITSGITLSTICGLLVGLHMGLFPGIRNLFRPFTVFILNIPPLAILPILLIVFNVGEFSKIMLIFVGTYPVITMSIYLAVKAIPWELVIKAQTLGATQFGATYRVVLPMIIPNLLNTVSLTLGASWLFLISAEAIAASMGLGYRIFLVRRYLSMDVIIPYVLWITFLAYMITLGVSRFIDKHYPWFNAQNGVKK